MYSNTNVGTGVDITIREMVKIMKRLVCYKDNLIFERTKPDDAPRKFIDVSPLSDMGWKYSVDLKDGPNETNKCYLETCI